MSIVARLTGLFGKSSSPPGGEATLELAVPADDGGTFAIWPPRTRRGLDPNRRDAFAKSIERFVKVLRAAPDRRHHGGLQILDLEPMRLRFGNRWASLREKVLQIVETSLDRGLGADDLYVVADEVTVYLLVVGMPRREAEVRGRLLASEITTRLCGTIPGGVAARLRTLPCDLERMLSGLAGLNQLRERIAEAGRDADAEELKSFKSMEGDLKLVFHPILSARKAMVSGYRAAVRIDDPVEGLSPIDVVDVVSFNGVFDAEVDRWALEQLLPLLAGSGRANRAVIVLPLRYETLATMRLRDAYLAICRRLPKQSARRLVFEVTDLAPAMVQARIRDLLAYIRPFCLGIAVRVSPGAVDIAQLINTGVAGLCVMAPPSAESAADTAGQLRAIIGGCRHSGMRSYVLGCSTTEDCQIALREGAGYLDGDGFLRPVRSAGRVFSTRRG